MKTYHTGEPDMFPGVHGFTGLVGGHISELSRVLLGLVRWAVGSGSRQKMPGLGSFAGISPSGNTNPMEVP